MNDVGIAAPFRRDAQGKPVVECDDASLYAFGHLMRSTEQLILDLFGRGLLSGTTHTCLGQELCQLSVVRALNDPDDVVLSNHRNHGHFMAYSGEILGLVGAPKKGSLSAPFFIPALWPRITSGTRPHGAFTPKVGAAYAKLAAAKSQLARLFRKVSTNFGRRLR